VETAAVGARTAELSLLSCDLPATLAAVPATLSAAAGPDAGTSGSLPGCSMSHDDLVQLILRLAAALGSVAFGCCLHVKQRARQQHWQQQ